MCGLVGFVDRASALPLARERLERMLTALAHRGPDGQGADFDAVTGLSFGSRRLAIVDLPSPPAPIWNEDRSVSVIFNGEIYNYRELRKELLAAGHAFRTESDTEVLVHLYERDGHKMFKSLRGMFAFVIFDARRRRLLLARDEMGQKPLFWWADKSHFAFASEIKALLQLPFVPRDLNPDAFLDYISWFSLPSPQTHFRAIQKLAPGTFLEVNLEPLAVSSVVSFMRIDDSDPEIDVLSDAVAGVDKALNESLGFRLQADVPIGLLLSGTDSSCIAWHATQQKKDTRLPTFTAVFDDPDSEQDAALETSKVLGTDHHEVMLGPKDLLGSIDDIAWYLDEPVGDPASFALAAVCRAARPYARVLLSGEGADELFAGYAPRYRGIIAALDRSDVARAFAGILPPFDKPFPISRWDRLRRRSKFKMTEEIAALRIEGFPGDIRHPRGLTDEQLTRVNRRVAFYGRQVIPARNRLEMLLAFDRHWQLAEALLAKADRMSMAHGIEIRSPFLDKKLVRLAARIAPSLKLPSNGLGKRVLRECLRLHLPELADRPKRGFPIPLNKWLRGPLRPTVEESIFGPSSVVASILDVKLLREAWDDYLCGAWSGDYVFYALWLYQVWHSQFRSRLPALGSL